MMAESLHQVLAKRLLSHQKNQSVLMLQELGNGQSTYWVYVNAFTVHPLIVVLLPSIKVDFKQSEEEILFKY